MPEVDRRRFLQLAGGSAALSVLTPSIARAATIPAARRAGSVEDVEHVVVLMQENRSFDHYFGTMRGVRGFGDPHPVTLRNGKPVWQQPSAKDQHLPDEVLPFRPDLEDLGLAFIQDIDHSWNSQHAAFADGHYDRWVQAKKTPVTMAYLSRQDIPFHFALADAFTVCDAYHAGVIGPTDANRYYLWTGWVGNDGKGGGPEIENFELGYGWTTYPERLQKAGVSWKIYQDAGIGLDASGAWGHTVIDPYIGNYGDNSLLYFNAYRNAQPGDPLYDLARTGTQAKDTPAGQPAPFFDQLRADVQGGTLPQVSWIVAPEAYTEHPNWPANYGAWYVAQVLDALTSDPDVWARTVLFLTYDENDGFFDHVVPPYPNVGALHGHSTVSTVNEYYTGTHGVKGPYGLGVRVPMTVISPWSTGGWVCSETFDHTSLIRFMETRFGVVEPNITRWRRTVCGDLTSAFDFSKTPGPPPTLGVDTSGYAPPDSTRHPSYFPTPPAEQSLPAQEEGTRPARPLHYRLAVDVQVRDRALTFQLRNTGRLGAHLQARSGNVKGAPFSYTLGAGRSIEPSLKASGPFDVTFHGPHGFFRRFSGTTKEPLLRVKGRKKDDALVLTLVNLSKKTLTVHIANAYGPDRTVKVRRAKRRVLVPLTSRWYDVLVTVAGHPSYRRGLAGHFDNGRPSISDPRLGG